MSDLTAEDRALLETLQGGNAWLRGVACTLARRGVAFRQREPERAAALLAAMASWPWFKAGQFLFDLLEFEDFMVDGEPAAVVPTALDGAALTRLAGAIRSLRGHLDGAVSMPPVNAAAGAVADGEELPPLEAGFYLFHDVALGVLVSASALQ